MAVFLQHTGAALLATLVMAASAQAPAPPATPPVPSRGELLYANHCIACHNQQMHWRDRRLAADWPTLLAQVALWQERGALGWSGEDIHAVALYLNDTVYRYPREGDSRAAPAPWPR